VGFELGAVSFCFRPLGQAKSAVSGAVDSAARLQTPQRSITLLAADFDACHVACCAENAKKKRKERQGKRRTRRAAAEAHVIPMPLIEEIANEQKIHRKKCLEDV
jgi:hypothetical protein